MSKQELEALIAFHKKQAELNEGKEHAARQRKLFHVMSIRALTKGVRNG